MEVIIDPIMGGFREQDYKIPVAKDASVAASGAAIIPALKGGEKYDFSTPLKSLAVSVVENSPYESEILFTGQHTYIAPTKVTVKAKNDFDSTSVDLPIDDATKTGNARTFSATFQEDDPMWNNYVDWTMRCYVDSTTGKWTVFAEYSGTTWGWNEDTDEYGEIQTSNSGIFAVASVAGAELDDVIWSNFNYDLFPRGGYLNGGGSVNTNSQFIAPTVTLPNSVKVIGTLPVFENGKRYLLNFRDNIVIGAEVSQ